MSGCSPCVTTTTTSISFSFQSAKDECPPGPPACAESVNSLEYVDPPSETSSRPESPARPQSPALATAIGAPGLTAAAGQRWFAVTKGRSVGVFQGSYVFPSSILVYHKTNHNSTRVTIEPFVKGVSGNRSVGYATRELANLAFASAVRANEVAILD